jgi:excisionase family DNA binding protein
MTDALGAAIKSAVMEGVREVMNVDDATRRRLLSAEEAATYLNLSRREIYNMIAGKALKVVKRGKRTLLDIRDLEDWIDLNKS